MITTPELFQLRGVTHREKYENLCLLTTSTSSSAVDIPSNNDILKALEIPVITKILTGNQQQYEINVNVICVVVWQEQKLVTRYIGCVKKLLDNNLVEIEHLQRVMKDKDDYWQYPANTDIQQVAPDQILPCRIGEWDTNIQSLKFVFCNCKTIDSTFQKLIDM